MDFQKTIKREIYIEGVGIHTGENTRLIIRPSPPDTGISFKIKDRKIRVEPKNISIGNFNTTLEKGDIKIYTIEHLLSSLYGLKIDNAEIEMDNIEVPIFDGSAKYFVDKIISTGYKVEKVKRKKITLKKPVYIKDNDKIIIALPSCRFQITYFLEHPHKLIGRQLVSFKITEEVFIKEIAPARTFATLDEAMKIKEIGLAKGGSFKNAVVIGEDRIFTKLRFKDEMARHKVLDIIGDIGVLRYEVLSHIIGIKSGHFQNQLLCKEIFKQVISPS